MVYRHYGKDTLQVFLEYVEKSPFKYDLYTACLVNIKDPEISHETLVELVEKCQLDPAETFKYMFVKMQEQGVSLKLQSQNIYRNYLYYQREAFGKILCPYPDNFYTEYYRCLKIALMVEDLGMTTINSQINPVIVNAHLDFEADGLRMFVPQDPCYYARALEKLDAGIIQRIHETINGGIVCMIVAEAENLEEPLALVLVKDGMILDCYGESKSSPPEHIRKVIRHGAMDMKLSFAN